MVIGNYLYSMSTNSSIPCALGSLPIASAIVQDALKVNHLGCGRPTLNFHEWPKSNVSKVRAYCSAFDHQIRKIFSGVCRDSHWFEEYLKIIEIYDYFCE